LYFAQDNDTNMMFGNHLGNPHGGSERNNHYGGGIPVVGYGRGVLGANEWRDVIINVEKKDRLTQRVHYLIHGLEPGTEYEAKVQARNRFGWNAVSPGFRFDTRGSGTNPFCSCFSGQTRPGFAQNLKKKIPIATKNNTFFFLNYEKLGSKTASVGQLKYSENFIIIPFFKKILLKIQNHKHQAFSKISY